MPEIKKVQQFQSMKFFRLLLLSALVAVVALNGFCAGTNPVTIGAPVTATNAVSYAPAILPGEGLARHDFLYAGEAKDERMFIVRHGQIVWSYTHDGRGEISDAVLEPNGNILFAHQFGVTEVTADRKVVWNYDAPPKTEIHTAQPLGPDRVWFIQNGNPAKFVIVNKSTGDIVRQFELPVKNTNTFTGSSATRD
jgi:hypothetical protein